MRTCLEVLCVVYGNARICSIQKGQKANTCSHWSGAEVLISLFSDAAMSHVAADSNGWYSAVVTGCSYGCIRSMRLNRGIVTPFVSMGSDGVYRVDDTDHHSDFCYFLLLGPWWFCNSFVSPVSVATDTQAGRFMFYYNK
jgi:hypothetical protein